MANPLHGLCDSYIEDLRRLEHMIDAESAIEPTPGSKEYYIKKLNKLKRALPDEVDFLNDCVMVLRARPGGKLPTTVAAYSAELRGIATFTRSHHDELFEIAGYLDNYLEPYIQGTEINQATKDRLANLKEALNRD